MFHTPWNKDSIWNKQVKVVKLILRFVFGTRRLRSFEACCIFFLCQRMNSWNWHRGCGEIWGLSYAVMHFDQDATEQEYWTNWWTGRPQHGVEPQGFVHSHTALKLNERFIWNHDDFHAKFDSSPFRWADFEVNNFKLRCKYVICHTVTVNHYIHETSDI